MKNLPTQFFRELNRPQIKLLDEKASQEDRSVLLGKMGEYLVVIVFVLTLVIYEWVQWKFDLKPNPILFGVLGICLAGYAVVRIVFLLPKLRALRLEEQAVQIFRAGLKEATQRGWYMFENVSDGQGKRIGSVLVGATGVFTLTPRYVSRRGEAFETIDHVDAQTIRAAGHEILADPLGQARAAARVLRAMLGRAGLDKVSVQPLLVFPCWQIGKQPSADAQDVLVVNEATLAGALAQSNQSLDPKTVIELCDLLERHSVKQEAVGGP